MEELPSEHRTAVVHIESCAGDIMELDHRRPVMVDHEESPRLLHELLGGRVIVREVEHHNVLSSYIGWGLSVLRCVVLGTITEQLPSCIGGSETIGATRVVDYKIDAGRF